MPRAEERVNMSPLRSRHLLPDRDKYLVVGGHGSVRRAVCQYLEAKFPGQVVAAGRDINAAAAFESSPSARVASLKIDIRDLGLDPFPPTL